MAPKSMHWWHDRIIDLILQSPVALSQGDIARAIGYSDSWVSIMVNTEMFKARLAERKAELTDPVIAASINDRLDALAKRSLDKLLERLDSNIPLKTPDLVSLAKLGVGDKNTRPAQVPVQQNNLYLVHTPPPAANSREWRQSVQDAVVVTPALPSTSPPAPSGPKFAFFKPSLPQVAV